jgi:hypothetical protein
LILSDIPALRKPPFLCISLIANDIPALAVDVFGVFGFPVTIPALNASAACP